MHLPSWISNSSKSSQALALLLFIIVIFMSLYILEDRHSSPSLTHKNFCFMNFSMFFRLSIFTRDITFFFRVHCVSLDDRSIVSRTIAVPLIYPSWILQNIRTTLPNKYIYKYKNQTLLIFRSFFFSNSKKSKNRRKTINQKTRWKRTTKGYRNQLLREEYINLYIERYTLFL